MTDMMKGRDNGPNDLTAGMELARDALLTNADDDLKRSGRS